MDSGKSFPILGVMLQKVYLSWVLCYGKVYLFVVFCYSNVDTKIIYVWEGTVNKKDQQVKNNTQRWRTE